MVNNKLDIGGLEEQFQQYRFKDMTRPSKREILARATHLPLEYVSDALDPAGLVDPAIRVREPRRFFGLIPGRIVTTAYRRDERFIQNGESAESCYDMVCSEITFKPEDGLDDKLKEQLIRTLTPSIPEEFRTPQKYFAIGELGVKERGKRSYTFYEPRGTETLPPNSPNPGVLDY